MPNIFELPAQVPSMIEILGGAAILVLSAVVLFVVLDLIATAAKAMRPPRGWLGRRPPHLPRR